MKKFGTIIKILISVLSLACLAYIFFIDDYVGLFEKNITITADDSNEEANISSNHDITIEVPSTILYYENISNFDFLQDVSAKDSEGKDLTSKVEYSIKAGSNLENKIIEYYINIDGAVACSTKRDLVISNYKGPDISITPDVVVHATETDDLVATLSSLGAISATDGLGNNILEAVTYSSSTPLNTAGKYPVRFDVTNAFNDAYSLLYEIEVKGSTTDPVIALTTKSVTLPLGSNFNWRTYLDYATDPVEGDISNRIHIRNNIDIWVPGVYTVTYTATNSQGVTSAPAELTVIIAGN